MRARSNQSWSFHFLRLLIILPAGGVLLGAIGFPLLGIVVQHDMPPFELALIGAKWLGLAAGFLAPPYALFATARAITNSRQPTDLAPAEPPPIDNLSASLKTKSENPPDR